MPPVKIRMDPKDEYMHTLEDATNFNESMYFNVYDPEERVGGFLRLGNRANEGYAEMTTCLYLPDGRVGFMYGRPEIADNDAFDAGGMKFEVITPFEALKTTYTGKVCILDEPLQMANPRQAFTDNPYLDCEVILDHRGDRTDVRRRAGERRRHPAHRGPVGRIRARALRAAHRRSWGDPRRRRGVGRRRLRTPRPLVGSALLAGAVVVPVADHQLRRGRRVRRLDRHVTRRQAAHRRHGARERRVPPPRPRHASRPNGWATTPTTRRCASPPRSGDREYEITGSVLNLIPLRNRRTTPEGEQLVTRISEGMTEWQLGRARPDTASRSTSTRSSTGSPSAGGLIPDRPSCPRTPRFGSSVTQSVTRVAHAKSSVAEHPGVRDGRHFWGSRHLLPRASNPAQLHAAGSSAPQGGRRSAVDVVVRSGR